MLGSGASALFGQVGAMTCQCNNLPQGCNTCDNGCECLSGLGGGSGKAMQVKKVEEQAPPVFKEESSKKDIAVTSPTPNDRCFCNNHPDGCTSCDHGCRCKSTALAGKSNMTMLGSGASALFGQVGAMTCQCNNLPQGCNTCDNGCECLSGLGGGSGKAMQVEKVEEQAPPVFK